MPKEKVLAALGRRIFDAGPEAETVDYSHRTMAEYLAAEFLAARVRGGLPFGRVQALIGADGHPSAELVASMLGSRCICRSGRKNLSKPTLMGC